ncbi:B3 domain-containing protein [Panicum miliaceum]|uniref:B3 domain-containing protein n=1 Tax=Panicum miliaceum TaxID=4540 RepID=A0A3L6TPZ3_PANMI|nr:B3 domain-containing protein [Panicum miliaceum]
MTPRNHQQVKDLLDARRVAPVIVKKLQRWLQHPHRLRAQVILLIQLHSCLGFYIHLFLQLAVQFSTGEDNLSENESFQSDDLQTNPGPDYVLSRGSYLSEAQEKKVMALIQEIQPESTVYVAVMRKCHILKPGPYLAIPKGYAFAHFLHERTNITLQRPGKSKKWHPRFYQRKDKRVYVLRGQWLDFARDNHVQVEDICILVPAKGGRRFTFTVYLLRATATHSRGETAFQRVGSFHGRSSTKMASAVHVKEESSDDNVSSESDMDEASHKSLKSNSGGPSEAPYIVSSKSCLSQSQKKIVEEKVRAIQSEVPIFCGNHEEGECCCHSSLPHFGIGKTIRGPTSSA